MRVFVGWDLESGGVVLRCERALDGGGVVGLVEKGKKPSKSH